MKDFVSFGTYFQLMYFMSIRLLKDKINGFLVPTFQLAYICDTNNPSHKKMVKLCHEVHYMWWGNKDLELREWDDFIN